MALEGTALHVYSNGSIEVEARWNIHPNQDEPDQFDALTLIGYGFVMGHTEVWTIRFPDESGKIYASYFNSRTEKVWKGTCRKYDEG